MPPPILTPAQAQPSEPADKLPCGICRRQFARYTCPRCNLPYCSLPCFRSEAHAQCSEPFYRTQLEADIRSEPSKSAQERAQMLALLQRFEADAQDDADALADDNDDDDALERRLAGLDLGTVPPDELWALLTAEERAKFLHALQDPSSELAQQLLASEALAGDAAAPWWEAPPDVPPDDEDEDDDVQAPTAGRTRFGRRPEPLQVPEALLDAAPPTLPLAYNLVAVLLAYAYTTRRLSTSPLADAAPDDAHAARLSIARLVPFLVDRRSKVRLESLQGAVTDVWARAEPETMSAPLLALLLRDVATLLTPDRIALAAQSAPCSATLCALADLHALFRRPGAAPDPVGAKIQFYSAQAARADVRVVEALRAEVAARARAAEREAHGAGADSEARGVVRKAGGEARKGPLVTEIT